MSLAGFYSARCMRGPGGFTWLEAAVRGAGEHDARVSPIDLRDRRLRIGKLGLHLLDLQLTQGDLVGLVRRRAAAAAAADAAAGSGPPVNENDTVK